MGYTAVRQLWLEESLKETLINQAVNVLLKRQQPIGNRVFRQC